MPKSREALAIVRHDNFDVMPLDPKSRCTVTSVAAHFLYEKTRPDILHGPAGALLLPDTTYEQVDYRTVRVRGAKFEPEQQGEYTLKLEGARTVSRPGLDIGRMVPRATAHATPRRNDTRLGHVTSALDALVH